MDQQNDDTTIPIPFDIDSSLTENGTGTGSPPEILADPTGTGSGSTTSNSPTISLRSAPPRTIDGGVLPTTASLPNLTSLQNPITPFAMEPNWPSQGGFYSYYQPEALRSSFDRQSTLTQPSMHSYDESIHRRAATLPHNPTFLPPPVPIPHPAHNSANGGNVNLPPLPQTIYGNYPTGSSSASVNGNTSGSQSTPANMHNMGYSVSNPSSGGFHYPLTSPIGLTDSFSPGQGPGGQGRIPPVHSYSESPRIPVYSSSSPGTHSLNHHHLSPTSPTHHLLHGMNPSSASTSSSSFPSIQRTPANLPTRGSTHKRRSTSASHSTESWDEIDNNFMPTSTEAETRELMDDQPWGMPQAEYKALNPRDKKQVRNRIGARRFRAKRKDYVQNLEHALRTKDDEISALKMRSDSQQREINNLRSKLGLPTIDYPPAVTPNNDTSGLGLVMNQSGSTPNGDNGNGPTNQTQVNGNTQTQSSSGNEWGKTKIENVLQ
ncbi:hypothetical protein I302_107342 [Kwoniella bestiolae CBS 10118]|uniref:BZIP domain-containing protein n=1 Tax=Kwoniella bestiolae CBS 10118 TaxID=1296100 RepID=A0A1B9FYT8_9TREE|nr:hypothetical protein I302_06922 [Kwoniella bestiolae CBS 10118]OCF23936.1 hypothetical protein I302_06922 [Kwoniella bestiolae CBS 10118]